MRGGCGGICKYHSHGSLKAVVPARMFVSDVGRDWEVITRAHGAWLGDILLTTIMVQATLIGDAYFVEIEAEAGLSS